MIDTYNDYGYNRDEVVREYDNYVNYDSGVCSKNWIGWGGYDEYDNFENDDNNENDDECWVFWWWRWLLSSLLLLL